jgi:hypothetical protein
MSQVVLSHTPIQLTCPHCRIVLRLRRRPGDPTEFDCPDCHKRLELFEQEGETRLRAAPEPAPPTTPRRTSAVVPSLTFSSLTDAPKRWTSRAAKSAAHWAKEPLLVTWVVAGIAAIGLGLAFWRTHQTPTVVTTAHHAPSNSENASVRPNEAVGPRDDVGFVPRTILEPIEAPRFAVAVQKPVEARRPPISPPRDPREVIAEALSQRVLRFEQPTPVPFEQLRFQLEEMSGVAIRYHDAVKAATRERPVTTDLTNATVEELLVRLAQQVGLKPVIDVDGVVLVPASENAAAAAGSVATGP